MNPITSLWTRSLCVLGTPGVAKLNRNRRRLKSARLLAAALPLVLSCSDATSPPSDSAVNWEAILPSLEDNVYQVFAIYRLADGRVLNSPMGTAFPVAKSMNVQGRSGGGLATNAHVFDGILDLQERLQQNNLAFTFVVVRAKTRIGDEDGTFTIVYGASHAGYSGIQSTTQQSPDVAVIQVDRPLPVSLRIASNPELRSLRTGQPVATIGYPAEGGPASGERPIPTFKSGTISALRPYRTDIPPSPETTRVIQHDISTVGGTSGSPIFNREGEVIAVHNSGDFVFVDGVRIGSGAGSYAIRADELQSLLESFGIR